ncbi:MAG: hypothetical protein ACTSPY_10255 [Candidatus Helarchaeota archaeon]
MNSNKIFKIEELKRYRNKPSIRYGILVGRNRRSIISIQRPTIKTEVHTYDLKTLKETAEVKRE